MATIEIQTTGRTDLDHLFAKSGCLRGHQPHHPFLAFVADGDRVSVRLVGNARELVDSYPPETPVMVQWPGRWTSDFFKMTVADVADGLQHHT